MASGKDVRRIAALIVGEDDENPGFWADILVEVARIQADRRRAKPSEPDASGDTRPTGKARDKGSPGREPEVASRHFAGALATALASWADEVEASPESPSGVGKLTAATANPELGKASTDVAAPTSTTDLQSVPAQLFSVKVNVELPHREKPTGGDLGDLSSPRPRPTHSSARNSSRKRVKPRPATTPSTSNGSVSVRTRSRSEPYKCATGVDNRAPRNATVRTVARDGRRTAPTCSG